MRFGDAADEGQTDADAAVAPGAALVEPREPLEDPLAVGRGDAGPVVLHDVFREMYRVLRSPGRIAIADLVADGPPPAREQELCRALTRADYRAALEEAGFEDVSFAELHPRDDGFASVGAARPEGLTRPLHRTRPST